jgi:hypothetical protein
MQLSVDNQFACEANGEVVQALQRQGVIDVQQKFLLKPSGQARIQL